LEVKLDDIEEMLELLSGKRATRRVGVAGLNADRADSIVGGVLGVTGAMTHMEASRILVSGSGLREGVALDDIGSDPLPSPESVRRASVAALSERFTGWSELRAERKTAIALALLQRLAPELPEDIGSTVREAANVLQMGASIDFYNRHDHAGQLVEGSDLLGFSHRAIALLAGTIRSAEGEHVSIRSLRPLVSESDRPWLAKAGVALELAEEIDSRFASKEIIAPAWALEGKEVVLLSPVPPAWPAGAIDRRFREVFGLRLRIGSSSG
jgi:exopolyphosphatase/guanosine-5'-triphosphate,3'-diphosphate pyrophosphatase